MTDRSQYEENGDDSLDECNYVIQEFDKGCNYVILEFNMV